MKITMIERMIGQDIDKLKYYMKHLILILIIFCFYQSCKNSDCKDIPHMFKNFAEAQKFVRGLDWTYSDAATFDASWINSAEYYSCDRNTGFFIMCTDDKCYIHDYVEMEVWKEFKKTSNLGSYYREHMYGVYQMYDRVEQR